MSDAAPRIPARARPTVRPWRSYASSIAGQAFTNDELLALAGALDLVEGHAPVDCPLVAVESLSDEIGAEIKRRAPVRSVDQRAAKIKKVEGAKTKQEREQERLALVDSLMQSIPASERERIRSQPPDR